MSQYESEWVGGVYYFDLGPVSLAEVRRMIAANPEPLSVNEPGRRAYKARVRAQRWRREYPISRIEAVFTVIVTLAFAPFLQGIVNTLGNQVGEVIAEELKRLLRKRDEDTSKALNGRPLAYQLQPEKTKVTIRLPKDDNERVEAITMLPSMEFNAFGDGEVYLWWHNKDKTWLANARSVVSIAHWDKDGQKWLDFERRPYQYAPLERFRRS